MHGLMDGRWDNYPAPRPTLWHDHDQLSDIHPTT